MTSLVDIPVYITDMIQVYAGSNDLHAVMAQYHNARVGSTQFDPKLGGTCMNFRMIVNPGPELDPMSLTNIALDSETDDTDLSRYPNLMYLSVNSRLDFLPPNVKSLGVRGGFDPALDYSRVKSMVIRCNGPTEIPRTLVSATSLVVYKCPNSIVVPGSAITSLHVDFVYNYTDCGVAFAGRPQLEEISVENGYFDGDADLKASENVTLKDCKGSVTVSARSVSISDHDQEVDIAWAEEVYYA